MTTKIKIKKGFHKQGYHKGIKPIRHRDTTREKCEGCGIAIGGKEESSLVDYRGHQVCYHCINDWKKQEKRKGKNISWENFINPPTPSRYKKRTILCALRGKKR